MFYLKKNYNSRLFGIFKNVTFCIVYFKVQLFQFPYVRLTIILVFFFYLAKKWSLEENKNNQDFYYLLTF